MSQICPHCNYARNASDDAPDWQCPACEKAYGKAGGSLPPEGFRQYGAAAAPASSAGVGKWLLLLLVLGAAFWLARPYWQQRNVAAEMALSANQPEIQLYATEWCGYCKASRDFFQANGIRYTEHDIEKSSVALSEHKKLGGNGVPLIVVGDEVIRGWNEGRLRELLKPWLRG